MVAKAQKQSERMPVQPQQDSVAAAEVSLYRNVLKIKKEHALDDLGISFYDAETTIQWSYNADTYFHAASTMKLAVLLGVFRQVARGELQLDAPVHVRNRFTSIVNQEPFMLDLGRDALGGLSDVRRQLEGGQATVVQLPVASDQVFAICHVHPLRATAPGSFLPSMKTSDATPPVETKPILLSSSPASAETESPVTMP